MPGGLACGRTLPKRGRAAREALRGLVEAACRADRRLKAFHPGPRTGPGDRGECFDLNFLARPLPAVRLPDGSSPFLLDRRVSEEAYSGSLPLDGPADPRLGPLWAACLDVRPLRAGLGFALRTPELFEEAAVRLDLQRRQSGLQAALQLTYFPRAGEVDAAARFLAAVGLGHPGELDQPAGPGSPGATRTVLLTGLPAESRLLLQFSEGLERLGWTSPEAISRCSFLVADDPISYTDRRGRFNALARGWFCEIPGWYRNGFDPYAGPPAPPAGEEWRYPAAAYVKKSRAAAESPTIQIDVVHAEEGSYLEFQSAEGPRVVRRYADLAGAEVAMWDGPPAGRWSGTAAS